MNLCLVKQFLWGSLGEVGITLSKYFEKPGYSFSISAFLILDIKILSCLIRKEPVNMPEIISVPIQLPRNEHPVIVK